MTQKQYDWVTVKAANFTDNDKDVEIGIDAEFPDRYYLRDAEVSLELAVRAIFYIRKGFDPDTKSNELFFKRQEVLYEKTANGYYFKWKEGSELIPLSNGRINNEIFLIDCTPNK